MAAPATASHLLELIRKSEVVAPEQLDGFLGRLTDADQLTPTEMAGRMVREGMLTAFQANHLLKGRYKNFHIGKFKVMEPLGSGGMSQVFLCEHRQMRHRVALKMLPIKESTDPTAVSRFLREARAAASVNHPNVVRAHDFDQADGKFYYLIMDYVDGVNLHDLVRNLGPLAPEQAAHYIAQAADGLQHIGEKGLIHRDLKPSNLLLDRSGVIRILDLGLARFTEDDKDNITRQFQNNTVMGTADYLAPEQAMMMDGLDIRADIYSLGATFYFLLTGHAPFETATVTQKLLAHQLREPDPLPDHVPAGIRAVVHTMMRKTPEERFQQPDDIIDALADWTALPLPPPEESFFPRRGGGPRTGGGSGFRPGPPSTSGHGNKTQASGRMPTGALAATAAAVARATASGRMLRPPSQMAADTPAVKSKTPLLLAGLAVGVLVIAGVAVAVLNPFKAKKEEASAPPPAGQADVNAPPFVAGGPAVPAGSVAVSAAGPIKTVQAALEVVAANGKILLTDATHRELLTVDSPKPGVTVQGWPADRPVTWAAPAGSAAGTPLVRVENATGFTLTNVTLDGGGKTAVLVRAAGTCPGLTLDAVKATGFKSAAVQLTGCQGEAGSPIRVRKLHVVGMDDGNGVGVRVAAAAEGNPNRHVTLDTCRFDGPLAAAVEVTGAADPLAVAFCRFFRVTTAVSVPGKAAPKLALSVVNNTFAEVRTALHFAVVPPPTNTLTVLNNLFVKTDRMAACDLVSGVPAFDPPAWVWHNENLPADKSTIIPAGTRYFRKTFDLPAVPTGPATLDIGCAASFKVWVNGELVGESRPKHFTKRVFAFDVSKLLKKGPNLIAVEGVNTLDTINPGYAQAAGLLVRLAADKTTVMTDETWKSTDAVTGDGWTKVGFADAEWKPVLPWAVAGFNMPWRTPVWDAAVAGQLGSTPPPAVVVGGNVRDYLSNEGFPMLDSVRGRLPDDFVRPADADEAFLRTPLKSTPRLGTAGVNGTVVGVPAGR